MALLAAQADRRRDGGDTVGVTLVCEYTKRSMDLGYIGFNRLRRKIAELAGEPFLSHYAKLDNLLFGTEKDFQAFDLVTARMFWTGEVSPHVIEFCMQSDCGGFVTWRTCRKLLKIIGDYDDELAYGYAARPNSGFKDFKRILEDCVKRKCSMRWR